MGAILEPGDEVLVLAPYWPLITGIIRCFHGIPVVVPFIGVVDSPEAAVEQLRRHRSPATVALYISTPNNPTGRVIPRGWTASAQGVVFAQAGELQASWVTEERWLYHHRFELETYLIAAHLFATGRPPSAQFLG